MTEMQRSPHLNFKDATSPRKFLLHPVTDSGALSMCRHPHAELTRIPRLHEHGSRPCEFTNQTFSAADARNYASARHALHDVFTIPSHEVAVVDDILLTLDKLYFALVVHLRDMVNAEVRLHLF